MDFAHNLKNLRKSIGISQEELAEKINVSRQAVTKWETGNGIPDIENIISLASLFKISLDEMLLNKESTIKKDYMFESITEYDIDDIKQYDINVGTAHSVFLQGQDSEKIYIKLCSNTIESLQESFKVKIDDIKNRIDIDINKHKKITKTEAKAELFVFIQLPNKYIKGIDVSVHAKSIEVNSLQSENIELDIKARNILLENISGSIEINCNEDMNINCKSLDGILSINQWSALSTLFIPEDVSFKAIQKGLGTKIYYEKNGKQVESFSKENANNIIECNGIKSELIISCLARENQ